MPPAEKKMVPMDVVQKRGFSNEPWLPILLFLAAAGAGFLVYRGSLSNEFVWDDPIVLNQQLQAFHSLGDIFFPPPRIPQFGSLYYRPVIMLTYAIDRWAWGDTPFGFHFPVILFHAINCGFVFLIGRRLFGRGPAPTLAAFSGAILFATHPIHTESVCWMAGRSDTIAALFLLPALLAYLAWKAGRQSRLALRIDGALLRFGLARTLLANLRLLLAALLFLIACFAKESGLGFVFLVLAADLLKIGFESDPSKTGALLAPGGAEAGGSAGEPGRRRRRSGTDTSEARGRHGQRERPGGKIAPSKAPAHSGAGPVRAQGRFGMVGGWALIGMAGAVYFGMRSAALGAGKSSLRPQDADLLNGLLNMARAVGFYLEKILIPINLDAYIPTIPHAGASLAIGISGLLVATAVCVLAWRRGERVVAFLIAWFFGTLAPSIAIAFFQISEAPVAERYLYIPSVAFCLLAGYLAFVMLPALFPGAMRPVFLMGAAVALTALSVAYAGATLRREAVWRTDLAFWEDAVAKSPEEGLPHLHLGLAYANMKKEDLAEKEYNLALTSNYDDEGRSIASNNLGMLFIGRDDIEKAESYFKQAMTIRPDYATPYYGYGMTSMRRAERERTNRQNAEAVASLNRAEEYLNRAIHYNPQYTKAHGLLGQVLYLKGRDTEAIGHLNRVLQLVNRGREHDAALDLRSRIEGGVRPGAGGTSK